MERGGTPIDIVDFQQGEIIELVRRKMLRFQKCNLMDASL